MRALALILALFAPFPALACRLALVLAIDISNSVDAREYDMQIEGLVEALADAEVRAGLIRAEAAVTVMLWSGRARQYVVIPWRRVRAEADASGLVDEARAIRRVWPQSNTALADALFFAQGLFAGVSDCTARTIDVSGDGTENARGNLTEARAAAHARAITVNALVIDPFDAGLSIYFRDRVITRNGFVMTARGHESYSETLKRKMRREVAEAMM